MQCIWSYYFLLGHAWTKYYWCSTFTSWFKRCKSDIYFFSLSKRSLEKRIQKDIDQGIRKPDVFARSVERLEMYQKLNTYKIDVSNKKIEEIVKEIIKVGDEND